MTDITMCSPKQATKKLGCSYPTLLRRVKERSIPFVKVGNKLLFPISYFNNLEKQAYDNLKQGVNEENKGDLNEK